MPLQCRAIAGGTLNSGLVNAVEEFVSIAEVIVQVSLGSRQPASAHTLGPILPTVPPNRLQKKSDQVAAARAAHARVPHLGFGYSTADVFANPAYADFRELGSLALGPALKYIVRLLQPWPV